MYTYIHTYMNTRVFIICLTTLKSADSLVILPGRAEKWSKSETSSECSSRDFSSYLFSILYWTISSKRRTGGENVTNFLETGYHGPSSTTQPTQTHISPRILFRGSSENKSAEDSGTQSFSRSSVGAASVHGSSVAMIQSNLVAKRKPFSASELE